jgi:Fur family ferric uptake transcriptional regulator
MKERGAASQGAVFEHLRETGLRPTSARICVLQILQAHPHGSMTAEQIFQQLDAIGIKFNLATVYRVLRELEGSGIICREWHFADAAGKSRYLLAAQVEQAVTYTFVCQVCGRGFPVADKRFSEMMYRQAETAGFERMLGQMAIHICCNDCSHAHNSAQ